MICDIKQSLKTFLIMNFKASLEKLEELFKKWGLGANDWILIACYAHKLEGYKVGLRRGHFNIMVNESKLPFKVKVPRKVKWKYQIFPPVKSKWERGFNQWMKITGFDTDLIPLTLKEISKFINFENYSFVYVLPNKRKIRVITVLGLVQRYIESFPKPNVIEKELGVEKALYYLKIIEEWKKLAKERKDKEVVKSCNVLLKRYSFLKKEKLSRKKDYSGVEKIQGVSVYKGKVKGRIKIIRKPSDLKKFERGEILLTKMTSPKISLVISKVKGIITDYGGLLCHVAILAREHKIPCVFGTRIATKVLKDGDLVEVDARKGVVRILEKTK